MYDEIVTIYLIEISYYSKHHIMLGSVQPIYQSDVRRSSLSLYSLYAYIYTLVILYDDIVKIQHRPSI